MNCDKCDNIATVHITEIRRGLSYERHLCENCAETLLPGEQSDYSDYLDVLPPRWSGDASEEPEPTKEELGITGLQEQVVLLDVATGEATNLSLHAGNTSVPIWSPDSKRLAVCHYVGTLHSLILVEPGRPWQRRFLRTAFAEPASWSRDGAAITFSHPEASGAHILTADVTDGTIHRIAMLPYLSESSPTWSPIDDRLALVGLSMQGDSPDTSWCCISTVEVAGGARRRLVTMDTAFVLHLAWSVDAQFVAALAPPLNRYDLERSWGGAIQQALHLVSSDARDATDTLIEGNYVSFDWVPRAAGVSETPLVLASKLAPHQFTSAAVLINPETRETRTLAKGILFPARQVRADHLSADGRTLLTLSGTDARCIECIDVETGDSKKIDAHGEVTDFAWHPQGDTFTVLIRAERDTRIEMMTPDGDRREVAVFPREQFFDVPTMTLSPDGKRAALEVHIAKRD